MSETKENLSWLAFRYVANELSPRETSDFESRLRTDQSAREAVAKAIEETTQIYQALAAEAVVPAGPQRAGWNQQTGRIALVGLGSCAALFVAVCLARFSALGPNDVARPAVDKALDISPAQLAYAWAEARYGSSELRPETEREFAGGLDPLFGESFDAESEPSFAAPSWMLAALARMDGGTDADLDLQE